MIVVDDLGARLGDRQVLTSITLDIPTGSWLCLVGPNGAGKTTLLRTLLGVLPYSGSLSIDGLERRWDVDRNVAFVPQRPEIPAGMTVTEYVTLGRARRDGWGRESKRGRTVVAETLEGSLLTGLRNQYLTRLSGGEMQRVLIARAVSQEADFVLLDEPTSALDLHHQVSTLDQIDALRRRGVTIVSTMHDITLAAMYADRFALLQHGRLVLEGAAHEVVNSPEFARSFDERIRVFTIDSGYPVVVAAREGRDQ
jgi:iron complex transport system ATP-binding protein